MFSRKNGHHKTLLHEENIQRVKRWYEENANATQRKCADALGLSFLTVNRIVQKLRKEEPSTR